MEMSNEELIVHSILAKVNIKEPEQMVHILFDLTDHQAMRMFIYRMLTAAFSKDQWEDGNAAHFLYKLKLLELAINLAYVFHKGRINGYEMYPYIPPPRSKFDFEPSKDFQMKNIAQMLTLHEVSAPQIPFQNFFKFANLESWKDILKDLTLCALCHEDYRDLGKPFPSLLLYTHLSKLIDAMQVVNLGFKNL